MSTENSFKRRKFTLTEELDRELEQLADRHYGGNVSLCIRAAISEHDSTMSGEGRRALQRVEKEVRGIEEQTAKLVDDIDEWTSVEERRRTSQRPRLPFSTDAELMRDSERLYQLFDTVGEPLRVADVIERTDLSPRRVIRAIEVLVDHAYIRQNENGRYELLSNVTEGHSK